ncbi:unnamed protein product [Diabrotica balteata]|uniref:Ig-like domain-containing protein n=1 Tax=Diabrotica balteata TaxID=107213 RepID=A0A9N9SW32_DIABA|nr:unnamed protein product [Diabrotica balteata]
MIALSIIVKIAELRPSPEETEESTKMWSGGVDLQGPLFIHEPPHRVEFSNSSGGKVDCTAQGSPPPEVEWILADGSPVHQKNSPYPKGLKVHTEVGSLKQKYVYFETLIYWTLNADKSIENVISAFVLAVPATTERASSFTTISSTDNS